MPVRPVNSSRPSRYNSTDQPASGRSPGACASSKSASCHAAPPRVPTPGRPPTWMDTLALAVSAGVFQLTTPVLVTVVPIARSAARTARNRSSVEAPGASSPSRAEKSAVITVPATLIPAGEPSSVADPST